MDLGQPKSARRHASLGDITESSFNRVRQMTQMREQDSFKIKNRSHSSALDREIERQLYNERIQLEVVGGITAAVEDSRGGQRHGEDQDRPVQLELQTE